MESIHTRSDVVPSSSRGSMEQILYEVKKVIVGQDHLLERVLVALLSQGHLLVEGVPGPCQDADGQDPRRRHPGGLQAHTVHPGPRARGPRGNAHLQPAHR